jgi:hypothetical protein
MKRLYNLIDWTIILIVILAPCAIVFFFYCYQDQIYDFFGDRFERIQMGLNEITKFIRRSN